MNKSFREPRCKLTEHKVLIRVLTEIFAFRSLPNGITAVLGECSLLAVCCTTQVFTSEAFWRAQVLVRVTFAFVFINVPMGALVTQNEYISIIFQY